MQESRSPLFLLSRDVSHAEPGGPSRRHPGQKGLFGETQVSKHFPATFDDGHACYGL